MEDIKWSDGRWSIKSASRQIRFHSLPGFSVLLQIAVSTLDPRISKDG